MHPRIHAQQKPDALALVVASTGAKITYAEMEAQANRGAHVLRALGAATGDVVALICENRAEYFDI